MPSGIYLFLPDTAKLERTFQRGFTQNTVENSIISVFVFGLLEAYWHVNETTVKKVIRTAFFILCICWMATTFACKTERSHYNILRI